MSTESFTHLSYVNALTAQLFMYCWFGNEVEVKVRKMMLRNKTHPTFRATSSPTLPLNLTGQTYPKM